MATSIIVPLYIYPLPNAWTPLFYAFVSSGFLFTHCRIERFPWVNFIVILNPFNGPDGRPILPDENYRRMIPQICKYRNVSVLGYIHALYGKRDEGELNRDIDIYQRWHETSIAQGTQGFGEMGVDGIFIDEVDFAGTQNVYFKSVCTYIKSRKWRTGRNGISLKSSFFSDYEALWY